MSVSEAGAQVARHWVSTNGMHPLSVLEAVLRQPAVVEVDGFLRLAGTPLEVPGEYSEVVKEHMVTVALQTLLLVEPLVAGVCLAASRRDHNPLCRALWGRIGQYCSMPAIVTGALRTQRGDLQRFVADAYGTLLRQTCDPARIDQWLEAATQPWECTVGSGFLAVVASAMRLGEIQYVRVWKGASMRLWGEHGVLMTRSDHVLLFLLVIFVCNGETARDGMPPPVREALRVSWLPPGIWSV